MSDVLALVEWGSGADTVRARDGPERMEFRMLCCGVRDRVHGPEEGGLLCLRITLALQDSSPSESLSSS